MVDEPVSGTLETREDAGPGSRGVVKLWLDAIHLASKREENWRKSADVATNRFRQEKKGRAGSRFNILFANVQTLAPALYNSTPIPDVRKRHIDKNNPDEEAAKKGAQVLDRGLVYSMDSYDFDHVMKGVVRNSLLQGRGVPRVRYVPRFNEDETEVLAEDLLTELVSWNDFRIAPAKTWEQVSALYFRHRLTRDEAVKQFGPKGQQLKLDWVVPEAEKLEDRKDPPDIFKRATVWEVWDKDKREVVFIASSFKDEPLKVVPDPLRLSDFWPIPRPLYDVDDPDTMVPMVPYDVYRDQAEELDEITRRIAHLIKVLKWRGVRAADLAEFDQLKDAEDGDLVPLQGVQQWIDKGGLENAIWLMPIERLITVIRELIIQREAIKQTIFELTGVADIMRGQTNPNETLGAQRIKTEFGTLRLQERQAEVQRVARDLMRLKSEIMAEHFSIETLQSMTGIILPREEDQQQMNERALLASQPPPDLGVTWEDVKALISQDALREFRIDVETDSTIRGDLAYLQENAGQFVQGLGGFITAVGPAVQSGVMPLDVATDLLTAFARQFKLGRQAEDALDRLGSQAEEAQQQPEGPTPEQLAQQQAAQQEAQQAQADMQLKAAAEQAKAQEAAAKIQIEQQRLALDTQRLNQDMQAQTEQRAIDAQAKNRELLIKEQEVALKGQELQLKNQELQLKAVDQQAAQEAGQASAQATSDAAVQAIQEALAALQAVTQRVEAIEQRSNAPKQVTINRDENRRPVGATISQGGVDTEVTLN